MLTTNYNYEEILMTKFIITLLLATSISTSVMAGTADESKSPKQKSLLEKIFNTTAYDDGCVTYPLCDFDNSMTEAQQMALEDDRSKKMDLTTKSTDTKKTK